METLLHLADTLHYLGFLKTKSNNSIQEFSFLTKSSSTEKENSDLYLLLIFQTVVYTKESTLNEVIKSFHKKLQFSKVHSFDIQVFLSLLYNLS